MLFVSASCRKISWRTYWLIYSLSKHGSGKWGPVETLWLNPSSGVPFSLAGLWKEVCMLQKMPTNAKQHYHPSHDSGKNSCKKPSKYYPTWVQMIVEKGRPPNMEGYQVTWLILVYPDDFHSERHGGSSGDWLAHSMHIIRTRGHLHLIVVM